MVSIIELAQLLTGALDGNFNITNKSAVVQVVSCLEAFNITHESYRDVQNTRIIKDLQALRQNKANDQILAKRIKNLLRKWKERLAATVPMIQSSQPNSPQNMSQGSSDTQFMTQHSQSPPISQSRSQRVVNGPTSFTNLIPKQTQAHHQLVTPPIVVPLGHQNGTLSSQDSSHSLLGKRKFDNVADIDVNSNHSRNKLLKNSQTPALTSNNCTPPMPTVPMIEEQPLKKRGRKKGSKGIDSMLNGTIPDFQAEIRQKIALSAGKRNKTTMELQQMLESHQNTAMSWTNGDIDSISLDRGFNSLSSSHQPQQEASRHDVNFHSKIKQEVKVTIEAEDEPSMIPSTLSHKQEQNSRSLTIEDEIARLEAQLPPIDYEAAALDECNNKFDVINDDGEVVPCTCTFREVISYLGEDEAAPEIFSNTPKNGITEKASEDSDEDETDDFCAVGDVEDEVKSPPLVRGAVKSIFDPEYDANENLIDEMVRRKPRENNVAKVIEVKVEKSAVKPSRIEPLLMQQQHQQQPEHIQERVPIINYVCDEDPMCPARAYFTRDPVTNDDVKRLHRSFINGVNGLWNGIPEEKPKQDYSKDMENIDYAKHQLWKRVVPRYNFLTCDKIPKTFDDDSPFSKPPRASAIEENSILSDGIKKQQRDIEFREWHEIMNVRSYNDDVLTILPYVIID